MICDNTSYGNSVAGGVIILAGIAGVNPMEVVKRTAIPAIVALIVVTLLMFAMS